MATLVLTAAATAASASIGGVPGAIAAAGLKVAAGYAGRIVDDKVFGGSRLPEAVGLRLADLSVQTSTYGRAISKIYGTARVAGNIIWARPIKETVTTSKVTAGGKGGTGGGQVTQSQTTYSYSVTLAIAICEGAIDEVLRVWADAALIDTTKGTYRLYKGDEDQLPDTLIESFEGMGKTPAYRGLSYVVIEDFPLEAFGNRIPNFTFEVKKRALLADGNGDILEDMIKGVVIIPGSGEFVYDTVVQSKIAGQVIGGNFVQVGTKTKINQNNRSSKADALVGLDQLLKTCPNVEWVALVVTWFGDNLDAASCVIKPGVEYKEGAITEPDTWSSGAFNRDSARQITLDETESPVYGGTPSDACVLRYLTELRNRGLNILFYPMFFMDVPNKPWRGRVTGSTSAVADFFTKTNGYNAFINHYATLVDGYVDAFVIGSELIGLTKVYSGTTTRTYPAVDELVALAATVKATLGSSVKVTYAADWSEYHHTDDGWYNMDPLWASSNIDFVGIDAYFPLTDEKQNGYDLEKAIDGWTSGEGYDWYYTDEERTNKANLAAPYAWKNIDWWWKNQHVNPNGVTTSWVPESKKIWFTEYGFPSVDGAVNQPNVFYDPNSIESYFPRFSRGRVDFRSQRLGLTATEKQWKDSSMIERMFVWTWDARPFPFFPDLQSVWKDGYLWKYGHWINGKLGISTLAAIVADLCRRSGLDDADFDVSRLTDLVDGYVLIDLISGRGAIETLQAAYFFDAVESDGQIKFVPRGGATIEEISSDEIVPAGKDKDLLNISREQEIVLPQSIYVNYINGVVDYQPGTQMAQRIATTSLQTASMSLPIVLTETAAKTIADITLYNGWSERTVYNFQISEKYLYLEPTDIIELQTETANHKIRIENLQYGKPGILEITGVAEDVSVYDFYNAPRTSSTEPETITDPGKTKCEILDLPAFPIDAPDQAVLRFAISGLEETWRGAQIFRSDDNGESYNLLTGSGVGSVMGTTVDALADNVPQLIDKTSSMQVVLLEGELESISDAAFYNGGNIALAGDEIIQFKNATLVSANRYEISYLLRGRLGTEDKTGSHAAGEKFVLLSENVLKISDNLSSIGLNRKYKAVSVGHTLSQADVVDYRMAGNCFKPYAVVQVKGVRDGSGNIDITWVRRTRIGGDLRDYADVPLNEESEKYELEIMNGGNIVRTVSGITTPGYQYTAVMQTADFGGLQTSVSLRIYQISAIVGRGKVRSAIV